MGRMEVEQWEYQGSHLPGAVDCSGGNGSEVF